LVPIFSSALRDTKQHYEKKVKLLEAIISIQGIKSDELALSVLGFLDASKFLTDTDIESQTKKLTLETVKRWHLLLIPCDTFTRMLSNPKNERFLQILIRGLGNQTQLIRVASADILQEVAKKDSRVAFQLIKIIKEVPDDLWRCNAIIVLGYLSLTEDRIVNCLTEVMISNSEKLSVRTWAIGALQQLDVEENKHLRSKIASAALEAIFDPDAPDAAKDLFRKFAPDNWKPQVTEAIKKGS
jgi:HEAT repeat protein